MFSSVPCDVTLPITLHIMDIIIRNPVNKFALKCALWKSCSSNFDKSLKLLTFQDQCFQLKKNSFSKYFEVSCSFSLFEICTTCFSCFPRYFASKSPSFTENLSFVFSERNLGKHEVIKASLTENSISLSFGGEWSLRLFDKNE